MAKRFSRPLRRSKTSLAPPSLCVAPLPSPLLMTIPYEMVSLISGRLTCTQPCCMMPSCSTRWLLTPAWPPETSQTTVAPLVPPSLTPLFMVSRIRESRSLQMFTPTLNLRVTESFGLLIHMLLIKDLHSHTKEGM